MDNQIPFPYSIVMASDNDFLLYVLDLLCEVEGITYRKMMGEYVLYKDGIVFGGIYDNRFLIKKTKSISQYGMGEALPYPGGSMMYAVDSEDPDEIKEMVDKTISDLK